VEAQEGGGSSLTARDGVKLTRTTKVSSLAYVRVSLMIRLLSKLMFSDWIYVDVQLNFPVRSSSHLIRRRKLPL
jgi:hypothetical protein